jgi:hypothetical protein
MGQRRLLRTRSLWALLIAPVLMVTGLTMSQAAAVASPARPAATAPHAKVLMPNRVNQLDCNGYSRAYTALAPGMKAHCADPMSLRRVTYDGKRVLRGYRFKDNGHYVGHDEPNVKFISSAKGSGNHMTYLMKMPVDPRRAPTSNGKVTHYSELSIAPWFGLPMCDPNSYPLNPCKPDSDSNSGSATDPNAAGSAFMELQFYAPGMTPFADNISCSVTQWCAALTIDSVESHFNFVDLNPNCTEPVNFAFLQRNGVPAGPPSPQKANLATDTPNAQTLKINPGDVVKVSITDPKAGFTTTIRDLTTGQTGFMTASAKNGFANTNAKTCAGTPFTFHAEYSTARQQNQVPWAALEGGVLMQQEIGHFEVCDSVKNRLPVSQDGGTFKDNNMFQTCMGGSEGKGHRGEGPCNPNTGVCQHATTEGTTGPIACPSNNAASGQLCEFSDAECFRQGTRATVQNGKTKLEHMSVTGCLDNFFQNGDLDFDGTSYQKDWPDGSPNHPTSFRYIGPFDAQGHPYPSIQFQSNAPASEFLCNTTTGLNCDLKPLGSKFYPFFTLNRVQRLAGSGAPAHACVWNFGNVIPGVTAQSFGRDAQYGVPDVARFGGDNTSKVMANPAFSKGCPKFSLP